LDLVVQDVVPGGSATLSLFLPPWERANTYYKFGPTPDDPTPHWYEFLFDGTTGAEMLSDRIILHMVDGQRGDDDLTANGRILDPGGAGNDTNPGVVQFTAPQFGVIEGTGAGTATISVKRTGGRYGDVTVAYAAAACTAAGCAAVGRDYTFVGENRQTRAGRMVRTESGHST
jgi:hypothetical protein